MKANEEQSSTMQRAVDVIRATETGGCMSLEQNGQPCCTRAHHRVGFPPANLCLPPTLPPTVSHLPSATINYCNSGLRRCQDNPSLLMTTWAWMLSTCILGSPTKVQILCSCGSTWQSNILHWLFASYVHLAAKNASWVAFKTDVDINYFNIATVLSLSHRMIIRSGLLK